MSVRASHNPNFLEIAIDEYQVFMQQLVELNDLKAVGVQRIEMTDDEGDIYTQEVYQMQNEMYELGNNIEKTCIKIIVFLATYLESYIWDFAANRLGDSYVEKHLDKLSILSKWEVVPLLATNKRLEIKAHQLAVFKTLIAERNKLIHHKSINLSPYLGTKTPVANFPKDLVNFWERLEMVKFFGLIRYLRTELTKIDPNGTHLSGLDDLPE